MEEVQELKQQLDELQKRFNNLYKANEEKKMDNYKLRGENRTLKRKNYELTLMINTFLHTRRKNEKDNRKRKNYTN